MDRRVLYNPPSARRQSSRAAIAQLDRATDYGSVGCGVRLLLAAPTFLPQPIPRTKKNTSAQRPAFDPLWQPSESYDSHSSKRRIFRRDDGRTSRMSVVGLKQPVFCSNVGLLRCNGAVEQLRSKSAGASLVATCCSRSTPVQVVFRFLVYRSRRLLNSACGIPQSHLPNCFLPPPLVRIS